MALSVKMNLPGLNAIVDGWKDDLDKAVRPAAQAGAQVFYTQVLRNVPISASLAGHWFYGTASREATENKKSKAYWFDAGTLNDSIYQVYSKDNSSEKRATYHVAWNHKKAPYGFMVEFGTKRAPAHPFLNPAWAVRDAAETAMKTRLLEWL